MRNPGFWLSHLFQGLYACLRGTEPRRPAGLRPCSPGWRRSPAFSTAARATLDEPPSVFVETALSMLGGGGQLDRAVVAVFAGAAPGLWPTSSRPAGQAALQALVAFGAALRDEIEPAADPHAFAIGEEQFSRRLHHEHALMAGAPELWRYGLHLQEEITEEIVALAARLEPPSLARAGGPAPERRRRPTSCWTPIGRELDRAQRLRGWSATWSRFPRRRWRSCRRRPFSRRWCRSPPTSRRRSTCGDQPAGSTSRAPDPSLPPEACAQQRRGHCRHAIPAMVAHEAYPGHHLQLVTAQELGSEVRRHIWTPVMVEGWALYCEQLMGETGYYRTTERGSSSW